jgi:hypothetical protein
MLERKPFASLASTSLVDVSCHLFITITHSSIALGSVGAVVCEVWRIFAFSYGPEVVIIIFFPGISPDMVNVDVK